MTRQSIFANPFSLAVPACPQKLFARLLSVSWCVFAASLLFEAAVEKRSHAITITIEHTPEGENAGWDPDGSILTAHVQRAVAIWESLLPGPGDYEFDYHWDNDLGDDHLGLTTIIPAVDTYFELNPDKTWFADLTPNDDSEFTFTQTSYTDLTSTQRSEWFPGTAPPATLEVGYVGSGGLSLGASGVAAANGTDLLTVILHEMGHVMGFNGTEPGDYNIYPHHVGGLSNVLVKEATDDTIIFESHLAGGVNSPWLMHNTQRHGERVLPSATDVLTLAEDQGITGVHLDRVASISSGLWSNSNTWIGGAVPDATQDVSIRHGGTVSLDTNSHVKNLLVATGNSVLVGSHQLVASGKLDFGDTVIAIDAFGGIGADDIVADPGKLISNPGSLLQFNRFTRTASSSATAITFNGNVTIGHNSGTQVAFDPNQISTWNIGGDLNVGYSNGSSLVINNGTWTVGGAVSVGGGFGQGGGISINSSSWMAVGGNFTVRGATSHPSRVTVAGSMDVAGVATVGELAVMEFQNSLPPEITRFDLEGGATYIDGGPNPIPYYLVHSIPGQVTFDNTNIWAGTTLNVQGGAGEGGLGSNVTIKANSSASAATIRNGPGRKGLALPVGAYKAGLGGHTTFEDYSRAGSATIRNEAVTEDHYGSGGSTTFADDSDADHAIVENFGSNYQTSSGLTAGGVTEFRNTASAASGTFTNFPGSYEFFGAGRTLFFDQTTAGLGTLINQAGNSNQAGGETQFRGQSTAGNAHIFNRGTSTGYSGVTRFFDDASAGNATITLNTGANDGGHTEFNGNSNADAATIIIEGGSGRGGQVFFNDNSSAAQANFTISPYISHGPTVYFDDQSTADNASFVLQDNSNASIDFVSHSSADHAHFDIGRYGNLSFEDYSTAPNADVTIRSEGKAWAVGRETPGGNATVSFGNSQIHVLGANVSNSGSTLGGTFTLGIWATADEAEIVVEGGTVSGATGGLFSMDRGRLESATLVVNGGAPGALGGRAELIRGGNGTNARVVVNAGGTVTIDSPDFYWGDTKFGSIEGSGRLEIGGSTHLITGGRNSDTTISGPIVIKSGTGSGGRLTKIGTGTFTLAGANTYTGLTKVDAGTLVVNGSTPGSVEVNSGATLKGTGTIGGTVTVNSDGTLAPGASPGMISIGGLTIMPGGILDIELGTSAYDRIVSSGNASLAGILNVSLLGGFTPAAGNSFNILDWITTAGAFNTLNLPALSTGLTWDTSQLYTTGVLSVSSAGLPGDFNYDGAVDGSDFLAWQRNSSVGDLADWRANYGVGASTATNLAAPEPSAAVLMMLSLAAAAVRRRTWRDVAQPPETKPTNVVTLMRQ